MATEFTVLLEDHPGTLADLSETLARNAVNIVAMHATSCPGKGIVQFITNNTDATVQALKDAVMEYTTNEVLLVTLADEPGSLARLARALGDAGININSLYITMGGQVVLDVDDLRGAQKVALGLGIS
jgi:hypothetical protein